MQSMRGNSATASTTSVLRLPTTHSQNLKGEKPPKRKSPNRYASDVAWSSKFNYWEGSKKPLLLFGCVDILYLLQPKMEVDCDCTCTCTGNLNTSSTSIIPSKEKYSLHALDARFSHIVISREMSVPNMTVSGLALLLSLRPPFN
jgi:hypothetical protein